MVMPDREDPTKVMHAALQLNGGPLYLSDRMGHYGYPAVDDPASRGTHLYLGFDSLEAAQKIWSSAVRHKAVVHMPFEAQFWGSHYGVVQDPFGTVWAISAPSQKDQEEEEKVTVRKSAQRSSSRTPATTNPTSATPKRAKRKQAK
jgi:uncharacterized glyoxalase superfamily protein PhnB